MISSLQVGQPTTWITLNNGSVWRYEDRGGFQHAWFIGDQVELRPSKSSLVWMLYNQSYSSSIPVLLEKSDSHLPRLVEIEEEGLIFVLSDGTVWQVNWWDAILKKSRNWQIGDSLLVTPFQENQMAIYLIADLNREMEYVRAVPLQDHEEHLPSEGEPEFKIGNPRG